MIVAKNSCGITKLYLTSTLHLIIFYGNPSGEVSKSCTASLKEVTEVIAVASYQWERFTHLYS